MITNNEIKFLKSLQNKKERDYYKLFFAEGIKLVLDLLKSNCILNKIYTLEFNLNLLDKMDIEASKIAVLTEKEMERISNLDTPSSLFGVFEQISNPKIDDILKSDEPIVILDNINIPGNLGTIIRTADWFGIKNIVCSVNSVECYNPKVIQSTMGSINRVNIFYLNIVDILNQISFEREVFGAFLEGEILSEVAIPKRSVFVIGNESKGVSLELESFISKKIFIPGRIDNSNRAESLNVSIASGIIFYEYFKQNLII